MIYFVRHGESEANLAGLFAGQKEDSLLTQKGREQALVTAQEIKKVHSIDKIISSPLKRALETAQIIAKELGINPDNIVIEKQITEYDMGSLTGTPFHKISSLLLTTAENAEDPDLFKERVISFIKKLSNSNETILIVSHAGVGRILETIKENMEAKYFYDLPAWSNASVTLIDWIK